MNLVFEKIEQVLIAGETLKIGIAGSFLRLSECAWPVTVVLEKGGRIIGSMGKMLAGDYVESVDFDAVKIINGSVSQGVGVQISGGGAGSNRVLGEVSVIDGGKSRSLSGVAFVAAGGSPAVVGSYSQSQLWNPSGSGKNIVIQQLSMGSSSGNISVSATDSVVALGALGLVSSKKIGGGGGVGEPRSGSSLSIPGSGFFSCATLLNVPFTFKFTEPIVVVPGRGLLFTNEVVSVGLRMNYEYFEEGF